MEFNGDVRLVGRSIHLVHGVYPRIACRLGVLSDRFYNPFRLTAALGSLSGDRQTYNIVLGIRSWLPMRYVHYPSCQ